MTREQVVKVSQEAARKAADPKGSRPATKKQIQRLAELKLRRAAKSDNVAPVAQEYLRRA
jgi:hypothetical protein